MPLLSFEGGFFMSMFINAEGGLTGAGYTAAVALILLLLICVFAVLKGHGEHGASAAKQLTFCSMCIALAAVTSMIKVFEFTYGGSVTLCSMLFAMLPAWFYGPSTGILCGLIYGLIQFLLGPYFLTVPQFLFDYIFAFMIMGVAGFFSRMKNGLLIGYLVAAFGRWLMATIAGLVWVALGSVIWEGWSPVPYSMVYNIIYIGAEVIITVIIISIPAVNSALKRIKHEATA